MEGPSWSINRRLSFLSGIHIWVVASMLLTAAFPAAALATSGQSLPADMGPSLPPLESPSPADEGAVQPSSLGAALMPGWMDTTSTSLLPTWFKLHAPESIPAQRGQFLGPQTCARSEQVQHGPGMARQPMMNRPILCRFDQRVEFLQRKRPPFVPYVGLRVESPQVLQGIFSHSAVRFHP